MSQPDRSRRVATTKHSSKDRGPIPGYRLAAKGRQEAEDERLNLLEQLLDPVSRRRRELVQRGWRCLEVGAGRGSMAVWLAKQVGRSGHVVATDIDITYLNRLHVPNLEVRKHDILNDSLDVLDPSSFDLVCSRLTLFWLAGKQQEAIQRMVECLRPGGWLIDEDGDWGTIAPVDMSHPLSRAFQRTYKNGEYMASPGSTHFLDASSLCCSTAAALKTSDTRQQQKYSAEAAHRPCGAKQRLKHIVPGIRQTES